MEIVNFIDDGTTYVVPEGKIARVSAYANTSDQISGYGSYFGKGYRSLRSTGSWYNEGDELSNASLYMELFDKNEVSFIPKSFTVDGRSTGDNEIVPEGKNWLVYDVISFGFGLTISAPKDGDFLIGLSIGDSSFNVYTPNLSNPLFALEGYKLSSGSNSTSCSFRVLEFENSLLDLDTLFLSPGGSVILDRDIYIYGYAALSTADTPGRLSINGSDILPSGIDNLPFPVASGSEISLASDATFDFGIPILKI